MTVQTTSSKAGPFFGNGSTLIWNSGFRIDQPADLRVIYTDSDGVESQLDGTLYTATGFGDDDGVSVTYPLSGTPISAAEKITLLREVSYDQQTSITNQGGFYPQVIERALDRIVYQTQQIAEKLGRAITLSASSTLSGLFLPDPESGKFLRGRADGTGYENADVTGGGSIGIPVAIADGGTGATTATAARGNLGATSVGDALFTTTSAAAARAGLGLPTTADVGAVAGAVMALDANGKVPAVSAENMTSTGRLLDVIYMTSSGAYAKNPAASLIEVLIVGGGGGGGGCATTNSSQCSASSGGGGGGGAKIMLPNSALSTTTSVTVGLGGTGGAAGNNVGSNGGTSSFGAFASATGGTGGGGSVAGSGLGWNGVQAAGGVGSGGDVDCAGNPGMGGWIDATTNNCNSGFGGGSIFGGGAPGVINGGPANNGTARGAGGGGASCQNSGAAKAGGNGVDGIVIIREYA